MSNQNIHGNNQTHLFGKLFAELPPLNASTEDLRILANLMRDNKPRLPAADMRNYSGLTYFGQFIDHDITREKITQLVNPGIINTEDLVNERTSWFDLDSCFGENNEFLNSNGKFDIIINVNGVEDVPRRMMIETAIIGDPRNEENLILVQLHLLFLKFYNKIFDETKLKNPNMSLPNLIIESKKIFLWHYQYIVITQFLKDITGKYYSKLFDIKTGNPIIHQSIKNLGAKLPIEFSGAVYRFGHSIVRDGYYLNEKFDIFPLFSDNEPDLRGFRPIPSNQIIDWSMFFPIPYTKGFQEWEGIDPFIVDSLFNLPIQVATGERILPLRSMIRGADVYKLPCGQDLARAIGIDEDEILSVSKGSLVFQNINGTVSQQELDLLNAKFGESTPLFYYILMEAWVFGDGESLGPLGTIIIGGVFLNLLMLNQDSYLNNNFMPLKGLYGCVNDGEYYMSNLITYTQNLQTFDSTTIIPNIRTNFFDQHKNITNTVGFGRQHILQPTIQPNLIPEEAVELFPGYIIGEYDPTIIIGTASQEEVNKVALNALANGIESVCAVVKFISNKNIQAIAQGLLEPFEKKITKPIVNLPFVLQHDNVKHDNVKHDNVKHEDNKHVFINQSQLRARALNKTINDSLRMTQDEALAILSNVELEIQNALDFIPASINFMDFLDGDTLF